MKGWINNYKEFSVNGNGTVQYSSCYTSQKVTTEAVHVAGVSVHVPLGCCGLTLPRRHSSNTNLGMVRRSPFPLVSSCRENHTSNSFSVPSKKCAPLSSIVRQQTPNNQKYYNVVYNVYSLITPSSTCYYFARFSP